MNTTVSTASELGKAIKNNENRIIVKGSLGDAVISIEAVGPVAWAVAIGAIGVAIAGVVVPAGAVMEGVAVPALVGTLGSIGTSTAAIGIAIAGGGIGTLTSMRKYKARRENGNVVLTRR